MWLFLFPFYRWRNTPERWNNFPRKQQSWDSCLGNLALEALLLPLYWNHLINIYWVGIFSKFHKPPGYVTVTGLQTWNDRLTNKWRSEDSQHTRNNKQKSLRKISQAIWYMNIQTENCKCTSKVRNSFCFSSWCINHYSLAFISLTIFPWVCFLLQVRENEGLKCLQQTGWRRVIIHKT